MIDATLREADRTRRLANALLALGSLLLAFALIGTAVLAWSRYRATAFPSSLEADAIGDLNVLSDQDAREAILDALDPIDWEQLLDANPRLVGWVTVPGTSIDYPVVQGPQEDSDYYLTHDFYDGYSFFGCPYIDAECTDGIDSENVVIYGHHVNLDDTMFSAFAGFTDRAYAWAHRLIVFRTPTHDYVLKTVAITVTRGWEATKRLAFDDPGDYEQWWMEQLDASDLVLGDAAEDPSPDQAFTFCTCSYNLWPENERTLVLAREILPS